MLLPLVPVIMWFQAGLASATSLLRTACTSSTFVANRNSKAGALCVDTAFCRSRVAVVFLYKKDGRSRSASPTRGSFGSGRSKGSTHGIIAMWSLASPSQARNLIGVYHRDPEWQIGRFSPGFALPGGWRFPTLRNCAADGNIMISRNAGGGDVETTQRCPRRRLR